MKYEFTVTLKPAMYRFTAKEQFEKIKQVFKLKTSRNKISSVAELTNSNNIHIHSMVELKDHKERDEMLNRFRGSLLWGRMTCTQIENENNYISYMKKDILKTKEIIDHSPIIQDDFEVLETSKEVISKRIVLEVDGKKYVF